MKLQLIGTGFTSWDLDDSALAHTSAPVNRRGLHADYANRAGIFAFNNHTGKAETYIGFRVCLVNSK